MLSIKNITKKYKSKNVLCGVTLNVKAGEIKALVGQNGAGKSTLVEIICGVKKFDDGNVVLNNLDISNKKTRNAYKTCFGYMPQNFSLYQDLSVKENLEFVCAVYGINEKIQVPKILKLCSLEDKQNQLCFNLSGGEKQLLSFACSIIHNPKFLILDEPTSAMDPLFRKKFWQIVKTLNLNGTTILVITHYIEELLECDSFACLKSGKIVCDEKVQDFKANGFIDIEDILSKFEAEAQ